MKKMTLAILGIVILGTLSLKLLIGRKEIERSSKEVDLAYFLEQGVYQEEKDAKKQAKKFEGKIILKEDGKYYLYVGITHDQDNLKKMKKLYAKEDIKVNEKEMIISSDDFMNELYQYDVLLRNATKKEEVDSIQKTILSSYEEIVLEKS